MFYKCTAVSCEFQKMHQHLHKMSGVKVASRQLSIKWTYTRTTIDNKTFFLKKKKVLIPSKMLDTYLPKD